MSAEEAAPSGLWMLSVSAGHLPWEVGHVLKVERAESKESFLSSCKGPSSHE